MNKPFKVSPKVYPLLFAMVLVVGILVGLRLNQPYLKKGIFASRTGSFNKLSELLNYVENEYVDTINEKKLVEETIDKLLENLDPHSAYIPAEELQFMNEPLEGNFDGIGIEFHILNDTILVVSAISGGPSESLGIRPGDRIVKIEGKNVGGGEYRKQ